MHSRYGMELSPPDPPGWQPWDLRKTEISRRTGLSSKNQPFFGGLIAAAFRVHCCVQYAGVA